jgi:hypothetical protein
MMMMMNKTKKKKEAEQEPITKPFHTFFSILFNRFFYSIFWMEQLFPIERILFSADEIHPNFLAQSVTTMFVGVVAPLPLLYSSFPKRHTKDFLSLFSVHAESGITYLECLSHAVAMVKKRLSRLHFKFTTIPTTDVVPLFRNIQFWIPKNHYHGRYYALYHSFPYDLRPCVILDISISGKVLLAVLPEHDLSQHKKEMLYSSPLKDAKLSFEPNPIPIQCHHINDICHVGNSEGGLAHIIKSKINYCCFNKSIKEEDKDILHKLFAEYPPIALFSFISDLTNSHIHFIQEKCLTEPVLEDDTSYATQSEDSESFPSLTDSETEKLESEDQVESEDQAKCELTSEISDAGEEMVHRSVVKPILSRKLSRNSEHIPDIEWEQIAEILIRVQTDKPRRWKPIHQQIGQSVPLETIKTWFKQLQKNAKWRPDKMKCGLRNKAMGPELDNIVITRIKKDWLQKRLLFTDDQCKVIAIEEFDKADNDMKFQRNFTASRRWSGKFREDHDIGLRSPHLRRRTAPDPEEVQRFLLQVQNALAHSENLRFVINADETNWPVILTKRKTWFPRQKHHSIFRDVVAKVNGNHKKSFTALAAISAGGDKLPLYMLAKGKTARCHKQIIAHGENQIFHSESGWCTKDVMNDYLLFLRHHMVSEMGLGVTQHFTLIIDVFQSHIKGIIIPLAKDLMIELIFIPPGMTGELQPLDAAIFGELKSAASAEWNRLYVSNPNQKFTTATSSETLQSCWNKIPEEHIKRAWQIILENAQNGVEFPEKIVLDSPSSSSDTSDEEFHP